MPAIKALIVDDSKSARFSLRKMLKQHGVEVELVESGAEALEFLKNTDEAPAVIFMDHMMPDMDGFETTRAIIADSDIGDIPIIMCTSNEGADYLAEAKGIGAHGTISKPPTSEGLEEVIGNLRPAAEEAPAEAAPAASDDQIEQMIQAAVNRKLEDSIESITQNILKQAEARNSELISEHMGQESARIQDETLIACNSQLQDLREEVLKASKEQTNDLIKAELEGHIGEKIQAGLDELQRRTRDTEKSWLADQDRFRTTVNESAKKTAEAVMAGAGDEARKVATEAADHAMRSAVSSSAEDSAKQARTIAIAAMVVGVLAAAVVYFIK